MPYFAEKGNKLNREGKLDQVKATYKRTNGHESPLIRSRLFENKALLLFFILSAKDIPLGFKSKTEE